MDRRKMTVKERLKKKFEKKNETLADHFDFKAYVAFHFKEKVYVKHFYSLVTESIPFLVHDLSFTFHLLINLLLMFHQSFTNFFSHILTYIFTYSSP